MNTQDEEDDLESCWADVRAKPSAEEQQRRTSLEDFRKVVVSDGPPEVTEQEFLEVLRNARERRSAHLAETIIERTEMTRATQCVRIAHELLPGASEEALEHQALAFTAMSDEQIEATVRRLETARGASTCGICNLPLRHQCMEPSGHDDLLRQLLEEQDTHRIEAQPGVVETLANGIHRLSNGVLVCSHCGFGLGSFNPVTLEQFLELHGETCLAEAPHGDDT